MLVGTYNIDIAKLQWVGNYWLPIIPSRTEISTQTDATAGSEAINTTTT